MHRIILTYPTPVEGEIEKIKSLISEGLYALHVRKPNFSLEEMEEFLLKFTSQERKLFMLHSHHELVDKYSLKGYHISNWRSQEEMDEWYFYSTSCHSLEELDTVQGEVDYAFLSPIFDSITKQGYASKFADVQLEKKACSVVALGGIKEEHVDRLKSQGFDGYALLGSVWQKEQV